MYTDNSHLIVESVGNAGSVSVDTRDGNYKISYHPTDQTLPIEFLTCDGTFAEIFLEGQSVSKYYVMDHFKFSLVVENLHGILIQMVKEYPFQTEQAILWGTLEKLTKGETLIKLLS